MAVTARFKVSKVTPQGDPEAKRGEVEMTPDYAQGKNSEWAEATPSGVFRMWITNEAAFEQFVLGAEVDIMLSITPPASE